MWSPTLLSALRLARSLLRLMTMQSVDEPLSFEPDSYRIMLQPCKLIAAPLHVHCDRTKKPKHSPKRPDEVLFGHETTEHAPESTVSSSERLQPGDARRELEFEAAMLSQLRAYRRMSRGLVEERHSRELAIATKLTRDGAQAGEQLGSLKLFKAARARS